MASKSAKTHRKILDSVTEVMDVVAAAQEKRRQLPRDKETAALSHKLYVDSLNAIVDLVRYMGDIGKFEKRVWRRPIAFFKEKKTVDDIDANMKELRSTAGSLVGVYQDGQHRSTRAEVNKLNLPLQQTRLTAVNNGVAIGNVDAKVTETQGRIGQMHEELNDVAETGQGTYAAVSRLDSEVTELGDVMDRNHQESQATAAEWGERLEDRVDTLEKRLLDTLDDIRKNREQKNAKEAEGILIHFDSVHFGVFAQNGLTAFLRDEEKKKFFVLPTVMDTEPDDADPYLHPPVPGFLSAQGSPVPFSRTPSPAPPPPPRALVNLPLMLRILGIPVRWESPTKDLEMVLRQKDEFHHQTQAAAQYLLQTTQFRSWLTLRSSGILLADGNNHNYALHGLSPMSILSAMLVASISKAPPGEQSFVARFFCGLHCKRPHTFRGPNGLIRTLLAEMLLELDRIGQLNLDFVTDERLRSDLADHHLPALCYALRCLAAQFPSSATVYCIIDGVTWYETGYEGYGEQLDALLQGLARIVEDVRGDKTRADFKVLMTAAGSSKQARRYADQYVGLGQYVSNAAPGSSAAVQAAVDQSRGYS